MEKNSMNINYINYVSYLAINQIICPALSRSALMSLVDAGKVASIKMGSAKSHNRLYLLIDVVRYCQEIGLIETSDPNVLIIHLAGTTVLEGAK